MTPAPAVETTTTDGKPLLRISRRRAALRGWSRVSLTPMTHRRKIGALTETRSDGNRAFYSPWKTNYFVGTLSPSMPKRLIALLTGAAQRMI